MAVIEHQDWVPGPPRTPDLSTFPARLKYLVEQLHANHGLSGKQVAEAIDVPVQTFYTWYRDGASPRDPDVLEVIARLHKSFGVSIAWLGWGPEAHGTITLGDGPTVEYSRRGMWN